MIMLKTRYHCTFLEFEKGNFVVQRVRRKFSFIPLDQSHEQSNKVIKGTGGAKGLTNNPAAFRRWNIAGPEIAKVIDEFELCTNFTNDSDTINGHHEDNTHDQNVFADNIRTLIGSSSNIAIHFWK